MLTVRLKTICISSICSFVVMGMCMAADAVDACQASLAEDKPPCIEETKYVPVGDGSNVLKTTMVFIGTTSTNANGVIIKKVNLPPSSASNLPKTHPFMAPDGASMLLQTKGDIAGLGPAMLTSIRRLHFPSNAAHIPNLPLRRHPTLYTIGCPPQGIVTQPYIQIKGKSDGPMLGVSYDVLNNSQSLTNQRGFITDEFFDEHLLCFTTNYYQCFDIRLAPGTNTILIHCYFANDIVGTAKKIYILRLDLKTNAPVFQIDWPALDRQISGEEVTIRGTTDDNCAKVTGEIINGNRSNIITGLVERNGRFWLQHVPLLAKTNHIKITMTDVVGNSSVTNLTLVKSEDRIVANPVPLEQLWQMQVTVTGKISPPNRAVWVNGLKANVQTNGEWLVRGVPLARDDGVAVFDVLAMPLSEQPPELTAQTVITNSEIKPMESVSIKTAYAPVGIILNASQPTYGTFKIHLTGTDKQSFMLEDSINLVDWTPILTNLNSAATFDYYDTNVVMYGCRFFRVVPIR
jgi:hypothetical protein